jgi:RNA polymerase sigma factor (sigma-70 family)
MSGDDQVRVLVADDHAVVREGIRHVLSEAAGFNVVAEATEGSEVVRLAAEHRPDVIVLDITMPGDSGLEILPRLRETLPEVRVLILSMHDHPQYVMEAVRAGADGYVLKDARPGELREAIRSIRRGEPFFSPLVARQLGEGLRQEAEREGQRELLEALTARERDVLRRIADGRTNKEIASELGISPRTVESHRESLMRKLRIRTIAGLTRFAMETGLAPE